jgi:hypothetical protein
MPPDVLMMASSTALFAKMAVDLTRLATPVGYEIRPWIPPVLAVLFGVVGNVLVLLANAEPLTSQSLATVGLASLLAAGTAIGATELQKRARAERESSA